MDNNNFFVIVADDGTEVECEILFTFDWAVTGKSYVVYTDNTEDENGNTQVYASVYDPSGENMTLMPIETEEEWAIIEQQMEHLEDLLPDDGEEE